MGTVYLVVFAVAFYAFFVEFSIISYENSCIYLSPVTTSVDYTYGQYSNYFLHYLCFVGQKAYDKCHVSQSLFIIWGCIWTRMENSSSESQNFSVFCIVNDSMCLVWSGGSISNVLFLTSFIGWLFQRYLSYGGEWVPQDLTSSHERWKPSWEIPCVAVLRKDTAEHCRILSKFSCCPHLLWLVS